MKIKVGMKLASRDGDEGTVITWSKECVILEITKAITPDCVNAEGKEGVWRWEDIAGAVIETPESAGEPACEKHLMEEE